MKIAVAGLGLIGGSLAKGFSALDGVTVFGYDIDRGTVMRSLLVEAIDGELTEDAIGECDYIFIALYPEAVTEFLTRFAEKISKTAVVVDCAGTKRAVCEQCFTIAEQYGFRFIGGHPMAGTQFSGFKYSRASLFDKASMILVPHKDEKIEVLEALKKLLVSIGFKSVTITSAEEHDTIIAYTSQLAHVVSNAYVKSPNAKVHKGFSAGSYRDLTRVAKLNSHMWTELFLENADNLSFEIDLLIDHLRQYSDAIKGKNREELFSLLEEGTKIKESVD
ncbi:MAG: prephenate dehydrogenase [Ruminococcaceae bacterium]|nr:prephenate dehydrogenase [Oscillospiraceae bacterium]